VATKLYVVDTEGDTTTEAEPAPLTIPTVGLHPKPVAELIATSELTLTPKQTEALEALKTSVGTTFTTTEADVEAVQLLAAVTVSWYTPALVNETEAITGLLAAEVNEGPLHAALPPVENKLRFCPSHTKAGAMMLATGRFFITTCVVKVELHPNAVPETEYTVAMVGESITNEPVALLNKPPFHE
jgi:hypothetical protein